VFSTRTQWNLDENGYSRALKQLRQSGAQLYDLTASNPTTVGLRYPQAEILAALAKPGAMLYEPASRGLTSALEAVACYYADLGTLVSTEDIVLTVSTSEAYSYCFRLLCDPGDEVLIPQPSYPLFEFLAELMDVKLVPYELVYDHGWQIEIESLRRAITPRSRAIMLVHPNNPTGHYTKQWERECLNALCAYHHLALIVDEVFLDYSMMMERPKSFAGNRGALTLTLSGLSKISALPQMKSAWIVVSGPEELAREADGRLEVIADTYLSPNAPVQLALPELLDLRKDIQMQLGGRVQQNLFELDRLLRTQTLCTRLDVEGGWYAILRVPAMRSDEEMAVDLMQQTGVLAHPGSFFDFPAAGHFVLSLIAPPDEFREGAGRLLKFFLEKCKA
jgi:aspartate/methionine/tyrosine aminotransferase